MGCDGVISGLSGVYPLPFVKVRDAWQHGDLDEARKWQTICQKVCKLAVGGDVNVMQTLMHLKGYRSTLSKIRNNQESLQAQMACLDQEIADLLA